MITSFTLQHLECRERPNVDVRLSVLSATSITDFYVYLNGQDLKVRFDGIPEKTFLVELYSITGQRIAFWDVLRQDGRTYDFTIDKPLLKGLYIVKISSGDQVIARKLQV
jgi:hypothetical protein